MKRLSIIIPFYNADRYLERCIRSLEDQDIVSEDYEIICINDGSSDNSSSLVKELQSEFSNIYLVNQQNQGVSIARNNGINLAKGEYVLMIDADDYIRPNVLMDKLDILGIKMPEVAFTGYFVLDEMMQEEYCFDPKYDNTEIFTGIDFFNRYLKGNHEIKDPHRSWAIFYRTAFLNQNNLRYLPNVPYLEDGEFIIRVICLAKNTIFVNTPFYIRTTNRGSATNSSLYFTEKARNGFYLAINNLNNFKNENYLNETQKEFLNQPIIQYVILYITSHKNYIKDHSKIKSNLKKGPLKILDLKNCTMFYRRMGSYYNISILYFYLNWRLYLYKKSLSKRIRRIFSSII